MGAVAEQMRRELARSPHVAGDLSGRQAGGFALERPLETCQFPLEQAFEKQAIEVAVGHGGIIVAGRDGATSAGCRGQALGVEPPWH
ncbi:MAG: hypothetical protein D6815_02435 [Candidatus Dadabacteria bacterium]|nr:MAG: hypothetical protein D6815_02435 [Candidatus Dadabacteria bacterium]